jgi:cytidyltransferase-like protein
MVLKMTDYIKNEKMEKTVRPWGNYKVVGKTKVISVKPNKRLSLQYHQKRDEFWTVISGSGVITIEGDELFAKTGDEYFIPRGVAHRVAAGESGIVFLEIATGEVLEEDIVRIGDDYGRSDNVTVLTSGYFDPLHVGHLEYLKLAKSIGDTVIVILNNDCQACIKKGKPFMKDIERKKILESLLFVDYVVLSVDTDPSVCRSIQMAHDMFKVDIFAKGGDRFTDEIPEKKCVKS